MMLTVHGLPNKTKFQDVKALINQECNIPDFILDHLVDDGYDSKKVRIGLTTESDGYRLMKCLEGFRMSGSHVLKVVPVGKTPQPQPDFNPRSSYNHHRNDYPNQSREYQNDYNRGQPSTSSSQISPIGSKNSRQPDRHKGNHDRGLQDARQSLSLAMAEPRLDRYQGSSDRRPAPEQRALETQSSDFRDPSRGPLAPPSIRPASLDSRLNEARNQRGNQDTGILGSVRGQENHNNQGQDQPNPVPTNRQSQWNPSGTDPWAGLSQPVQNMNSEYNYQQPQSNTGYGQQVNNTLQGSFNQARVPQTQSYVQPKNVPAAPERRVLSSQRPHVLRSVELVDTPITPRAPPVYPHQHKPITIMKDNFQGPTQYNVTGQTQLQGYQGQGQGQQPWGQQGQVQTKQLQYDKSYDERRLAMEAPKGKPQSHDYDKRRLSPQRGGRTISPGRRSPRNIQTNTRSDNYSERRVSPTRQFGDRHNTEFNNRHIESSKISAIDVSPIRKNSPSSRRISPSARKISPGRRISPSRKVSPRRISPFSRKISPTDRRRGSPNSRQVGTAGRRVSPTVDRRRVSPTVDRRRVSPTVDRRRVSPTGRRTSPTVDHRRVSPTGRRVSPTGRRVSPTGRRVSPTGRRVSPTGRRVSPTGRRVSPTGRRVSPTGRRVSPTGRRVSPIGRRVSPTGRRVSPSGRRISPGKRSSDRRVSPSMTKYDYYVEDERRMGGRVESPRRYSPKRSPVRGSARYSPSETKYDDSIIPNIKTAKPVRPAYESNQGQKYTGSGFRNETHYPAQNPRIEAKPSWQTEKITYHIKKEDRNTRMGRPDPIEKKLSPRRSRSRSPIKDRFRRHSPSPRSPRRSWALEKRRSPDAIREPPPPPLWPGQDPDETPTVIPVWETDVVEDRRFVNKREKYSPRFSPRRDSDRREYRDEKFERNYRNEERSDYRRESPRRDDKKLFNDVDKDFQDIYQRSVEFRLKTDELRKSNDRRNRPYDEDEPREEDAPRERTQKSKPTWIPVKLQTKEMDRNQQRLDPFVKEKRDKAVDEIANRMLVPHKFTSEQKERILGELKPSIFNIMMEMFKDKDVSYIELVIKFRARYDAKDEEKILLDVLDNFPNSYKNSLKRKGEGINEVSPKVVKYSPAYEKEDRHVSHGHSSSKLTSRHELRKHGVKDGRVHKSSGLGHTCHKYAKQAYRDYEEAYTEAKPKENRAETLVPARPVPLPEKHQQKKWVLAEDKSRKLEKNPKENKEKSMSVANLTRSQRYTELSPLMNMMVEDELKNIMINVWQALPDSATSEAEKLVVDKLKGTAGDDLRNTIGLNITKRLLNVNNGILVKIKVHSPVTRADLEVFAKKHNISDVQYVSARLFAGRMQCWTDLDDVLSTKNLQCGKTAASIAPVYRFMKCPLKLRTVFDGSHDYSKAKDIEKEAASKIKKQAKKIILTADKVLAQETKKDASKATSDTITKVVEKTKKIDSVNKNDEAAKKEAGPYTSELKRKSAEGTNVGITQAGQTKIMKTETKANEPRNIINKPAVRNNSVKNENQTDKIQPTIPVVKKLSVPTTTAKNVAALKLTGQKKPETRAVNSTPTKEPTKPSVTINTPNKTAVKPQPSEIKKPEASANKAKPVNVAAKEPIKVVLNEPTKVVKEQSNTVSKEPVKVATKAPAKEVLKEPTHAVAKVVTKQQANVVRKEPAKVLSKEPVKKITAKPVATNTPKEIAKPKPVVTKETDNKPTKVVPTKITDNETPKTPLKVRKVSIDSKTSKKTGNDFDELSDRDILVMLNSGIVLDECCGSDED